MNWEALSPFFLFRIRNFPYQMGLTPFKIMFGIPQPLSFPVYRQTFWWSWMTKSSLTLYEESSGHTSMWPTLRALYQSGVPPKPHSFQPEDWVYIKRHRQRMLEPRWKGPFIILLTTPTAIKVDSVTSWIH